jgi:hypothetical protein
MGARYYQPPLKDCGRKLCKRYRAMSGREVPDDMALPL